LAVLFIVVVVFFLIHRFCTLQNEPAEQTERPDQCKPAKQLRLTHGW